MVHTKQTACKRSPGRQGTPPKFPSKGKPTGKAGKHLAAATDDSNTEFLSGDESGRDNNNNTVKGTVQAGRKHQSFAGKARVYKRPKGIKRKYCPGVGSLREICHYQREHRYICSKIACARLFREMCDKEKTGLCWQVSAIAALQEGF